jgi:glycosyltransferase involved in cell wall biosynthesis
MLEDALSLCMLVRDEEARVGKCLESAAGLAGEIIVVDTGSTDRTLEIAADYGARILGFEFGAVDFAAARNFGLEHATQPWILVLDADETIDLPAIPLIRELAARGENAGYYFERLNLRPDGEAPTTDHAVRLFPNRPDYRYRGRVHETVDASILAGGGRLARSGVRIRHDFAPDPAARRARNLRYIEILKEEIAADPADDSRLDFLAAEYHQLGMFAEATEVAERIVKSRPGDAQAHFHAGVYHLIYMGNAERARGYFLQALRLRPQYPEAQSFLDSITPANRQAE